MQIKLSRPDQPQMCVEVDVVINRQLGCPNLLGNVSHAMRLNHVDADRSRKDHPFKNFTRLGFAITTAIIIPMSFHPIFIARWFRLNNPGDDLER